MVGEKRIKKQKEAVVIIQYSVHVFHRPGEAVTLPLTKSNILGEACFHHMVGQLQCEREVRRKPASGLLGI